MIEKLVLSLCIISWFLLRLWNLLLDLVNTEQSTSKHRHRSCRLKILRRAVSHVGLPECRGYGVHLDYSKFCLSIWLSSSKIEIMKVPFSCSHSTSPVSKDVVTKIQSLASGLEWRDCRELRFEGQNEVIWCQPCLEYNKSRKLTSIARMGCRKLLMIWPEERN